MRTGDLQAPVGFDKWSYSYRDINGSRVHCSLREDEWGGEGYKAGDIIGCGIEVVGKGKGDEKGEITFYKNGVQQGMFTEVRGKTVGGVAYEIPPGIYYPAASFFNGGRIHANFGPNFVYPPPQPSSKSHVQPYKPWCSALDLLPISTSEETVREKEKIFKAFRENQRGNNRTEKDPMPVLEAVVELAGLRIDMRGYERHVEENRVWVEGVVKGRKEEGIYQQR
ncbi:hypothetical protein TL16_g07632 [Triparma laevis f. inornata]|uniref:B30.2/SPRY domain-containing protein n=1 Tax=Triparma laevis f. inornata TaxID=1714386 RepID=A0A9W7B1V9_9STRA|nr:hypothetical protein TL16_g07632 [Triparma laevis f. inornata]